MHPGPCLEAPSLGCLWEAPLLEGLLVPCRTSAGHPRVSAEREGQGPRPQLEGLSTLPPQSRQSRVGAEGLLLPGPVGAGRAWEGGGCVFASVGSHSVPAVCSCTGSPPNPSGTVEQAPGGWPGQVPPARLLPAPLRVSFRTPGPPLSSTPERRLGDTPRSGNRAQPRSPLRVPLLSRRPQGARPPRAGFSDPCCSQSHRGESLVPRPRQAARPAREAAPLSASAGVLRSVLRGEPERYVKTLAARCVTARPAQRGQLSAASSARPAGPPPTPRGERQPAPVVAGKARTFR